MQLASRGTVMEWLAEVMDPEVPAISVVDLGLVRDVQWLDVAADDGGSPALQITLTPTYSGCPATEVIAQSIREALQSRGVADVRVRTQLSPAWTTDWMTEGGRAALRAYGIAPPTRRATGAGDSQLIDISALTIHRVAVPCPLCESRHTRLLSQFGSTACKSLYQCNDCLEPFDYFKPH
jgi:ring-1,2-phenylacetyl-CoA epoxidase subunit PaaD